MKLFTTISQRLGWKLCLSYLLVILAVVFVLDTTAEFRVPTVLRRDVARFPAPWRHDPALMGSHPALPDEIPARKVHTVDPAVVRTE